MQSVKSPVKQGFTIELYCLEDMPEDYAHRGFCVYLDLEKAAKIKQLESEDGLWRTSLISPESYNQGKVSGSGFHSFAMALGVNKGILDADEYTPVVRKAWKALMAVQHDDGMVGWVQNIGASPEPASEDGWQNLGTGSFLLAGSQMLKLEKPE